MKPIAIFYHTVFFQGDGSPFPWAQQFNEKYMKDLTDSGLLDAADHFVAGINGGKESEDCAKLYLPRAEHVFHGLEGTSTNHTTQLMRDFCEDHPDWNVLYFHSKGLAHHVPEYASYLEWENRWIKCMVTNCIHNWRTCVEDLETYESVGCHWMLNIGSAKADNIWGGTFFWVRSDFVKTIPAVSECPLVKEFGINSKEARATSEHYIGLGPRLPTTKDYCINGIGSCP